MPYGVKWDHKLGRWVAYNKATGKVYGKHSSKEDAVKQLVVLKQKTGE